MYRLLVFTVSEVEVCGLVEYSYNLRWPVIVDMMSTRFNYNLEACQLRFYTVSKLVLRYRKEQGTQLSWEEEQLLNYK